MVTSIVEELKPLTMAKKFLAGLGVLMKENLYQEQ